MINLNELKLGDKVNLPIWPLTESKEGTVVYIHPKRRFFSVRFKVALGEVIENFPFHGPLTPKSSSSKEDI